MTYERRFCETRYPDGRVETFDPLIQWSFVKHDDAWIAEIGLRGFREIGVMWGFTVGTFSCIKQKWITIGRLTLYVHYGTCDPYNPQTGEEL